MVKVATPASAFCNKTESTFVSCVTSKAPSPSQRYRKPYSPSTNPLDVIDMDVALVRLSVSEGPLSSSAIRSKSAGSAGAV